MRKEGRVEENAHTACLRGPGLEPRTYRMVGESQQLYAIIVVVLTSKLSVAVDRLGQLRILHNHQAQHVWR